MNAIKMFKELKFNLYNQGEDFLLYKYETDYDEMSVRFDLTLKSYEVTWHRFIDNDDRVFVPMEQRPQNIKHSATYGHWQLESYCSIGVKLHNAIHQQLIALGWIE